MAVIVGVGDGVGVGDDADRVTVIVSDPVLPALSVQTPDAV